MDEIEREFLDIYTVLGAHQGVDEQFSRIYGLVLVSPEDLSLDEIARKTGYSLASVSSKAKMLESIGLVRKLRKPKSRKLYLTVNKDPLTMMSDMSKMKAQALKITVPKLQKLIDSYEGKKLSDEQKQKLSRIHDLYVIMGSVGKIMTHMIAEFDKALKEREK